MPNSGAGSGGELFKGSKDSANIYSDFPSHVLFNDLILLTLSRPAAFEDSHAITTRSHVAVCTRNSGAGSGGELFKGSKDSASLLVCTPKKFCLGGCGFFVSDVISGRLLGHLGQLHLALGPNR